METNILKWYILFVFTFIIQFQCFTCFFTESFNGDEIFDYIIVGAGSSGCIIATRLANENNTVLLIESGGFPLPDMDIPVLIYSADPEHTKIYPTVPQKNAGLSRNGIVNMIRGNTLGGSGALSMMLNRGNPRDYDNWAKITGDDSWKYSNLLKYFKKFERYAGDFPTEDRGYDGPITINRTRLFTPGLNEWFQAGKQLGFAVAEDPNGPQIPSFTSVEVTQKFGRRVTSYKSYIEPLLIETVSLATQNRRKKSNLFILTHTVAKQIVLKGNQAVGVKFATNSTDGTGIRENYVRASKEIIISGGAMESPLLLMKSGLGPKSLLEKAGVPVMKDLPVGQGLQDHVSVSLPVIFGNSSAALDEDRDLNSKTWDMYSELGDGPYTSYFGISGQALIPSSNLPIREKNWPNLLLIPFNSKTQDVVGESVLSQVNNDLKDGEIVVRWNTILSRPKSHGTIQIGRNHKVLIDPQYLSHPDDIQSVIDGLKTMVKVCEETSGFQKIGCRIPNIPISPKIDGCKRLQFRSDEYWACYAKQFADSAYHTAATCRMGRGENDPKAVVDSKLRVIGIKGLMVVDSSVFPVSPNANTQAAVFAVAEKAADIILEKWKGRQTE